MHNSYFLLRHLAIRLNSILAGARVMSIYSQEKDELVIQFEKARQDYFVHTVMRPDFSMVRSPVALKRARKNSVTLFRELIDGVVTGVSCFKNERCLDFEIEGGWNLLIKMFGNQSNLILCQNQQPKVLFKKRLEEDIALDPGSLNRSFTLSKSALQQLDGAFTQLMPTLGGAVKKHLESLGYWDLDRDGQWELLQKTIRSLDHPAYYVHEKNQRVLFTLFRQKNYLLKTEDVIEALNEFYGHYVRAKKLSILKTGILKNLERQKKRTLSNMMKYSERLHQLEHKTNHRALADLIMANLHQIPSNSDEIALPDFETGAPVKIKLKSSLSPQKNAERYYRKAKNQQKEVQSLEQNKKSGQHSLTNIDKHLNFVRECEDPKLLKQYLKDHRLVMAQRPADSHSLFKEFKIQDFQVLVGRNAANNDLLTQKHTHKEDLWLHAKDVKGSHVVIKHIAGRQFPQKVIEMAAQLAAYFSKRKHDSLCPVIYTPKKFVRKPKGSPPGQVVVDREQVILVTPEKIIQQ